MNFSFCKRNKNKCGTKIVIEPEVSFLAQFYCSFCRTRVDAMDEHCKGCGATLTTNPDEYIEDLDFQYTNKQLKFACRIFNVTHKPLPENHTKEAYRQYISENLDEYNKIKSRRMYSNKKYARSKEDYYSENPFAGPYGTEIVDCYDFGIAPWTGDY